LKVQEGPWPKANRWQGGPEIGVVGSFVPRGGAGRAKEKTKVGKIRWSTEGIGKQESSEEFFWSMEKSPSNAERPYRQNRQKTDGGRGVTKTEGARGESQVVGGGGGGGGVDATENPQEQILERNTLRVFWLVVRRGTDRRPVLKNCATIRSDQGRKPLSVHREDRH